MEYRKFLNCIKSYQTNWCPNWCPSGIANDKKCVFSASRHIKPPKSAGVRVLAGSPKIIITQCKSSTYMEFFYLGKTIVLPISQFQSIFLLGSTKGSCDFKVKHFKQSQTIQTEVHYRELINLNRAKMYHFSTIRQR